MGLELALGAVVPFASPVLPTTPKVVAFEFGVYELGEYERGCTVAVTSFVTVREE